MDFSIIAENKYQILSRYFVQQHTLYKDCESTTTAKLTLVIFSPLLAKTSYRTHKKLQKTRLYFFNLGIACCRGK